MSDPTSDAPAPPLLWQRCKRLGPTIIVAAVVLGPGSIVNASRVGCEFGYSLLWVVPMAGVLMMGMTIAAMMIGVLDSETPCQKLARCFGRPAAWLVGLSLLIAITLFQASNNNAMLMACEGLMEGVVFVDSIGGSSQFDSSAVRKATVGTLLVGFGVAAAASLSGVNLVRFIVIAQSLTVLCFPLLAIVLLWHLWTIRDRGVYAGLFVLVAAGLLVVLALSARTLILLI